MPRRFSRYELLERIGRGGFAVVHKAMDHDFNKIVAIKESTFPDVNDGFPYVIMREISLLRELNHVNVVRLFNVAKLPFSSCRLIMEYGEYDLGRYIREHSKQGIDPAIAKKFLMEILRGLNYCHSHKVMHRDLKPRNILIDPEGVIKIADFGLGRTFEVPQPRYSRNIGTLSYRAPEVLLRFPYTNSVDMWAVGCIFAELVTLRPLFVGTSEHSLVEHIISILGMPNDTDLPGAAALCRINHVKEPDDESRTDLASLVPDLTGEGLDLLRKMLCFNPRERITAADALQHPYLQEFGMNVENLLDQPGEDQLRDFMQF